MGIFSKWDKNGFDKKGFDILKIHKDTGIKFNTKGFDANGFDTNGFDVSKIHKDTGTKFNANGFDTNGFDANGFDTNGFDANGFDVNQHDINKKHIVEYVKTIVSIDSTGNKPKLFLDFISGNVHLEMIPFMGEEKFAKMISGGNFDFYDNDSPAYVLNIKFDEIDEDLQKKFISLIRRTFPRKFQIFPTNYSIGAYWINDLITEENASYYLRRIIENYLFSKL